MSNQKMLGAVLALPSPDLVTTTKIDDPIGAGSYYRADTVARMLEKERNRCAKLCEEMEDSRDFPEGWGVVAKACANRIRNR